MANRNQGAHGGDKKSAGTKMPLTGKDIKRPSLIHNAKDPGLHDK